MHAPIPPFLLLARKWQVISRREMRAIAKRMRETQPGQKVEIPPELRPAIDRIGLFLTPSPSVLVH